MKKRILLPAALVFGLTLTGMGSFAAAPSAHAAQAKQALTLAGGGTYYGQVENGLPDGRGTAKWPGSKTYSGEFADGKRSGTGKYINEYKEADTGYRYKIVYTGSWANDRMSGQGVWTEKRFDGDGRVVSNKIRTGVFANNMLSSGYEVIHAEADPEYSFTYRGNAMTLNVMGSNENLTSSWKTGSLFSASYKKGSMSRSYSIFPEESAAKERERLASIKYLQKITAQVTPHLQKFEQLSKQVPLK